MRILFFRPLWNTPTVPVFKMAPDSVSFNNRLFRIHQENDKFIRTGVLQRGAK